MQLIKPNTNINFIGKSKIAITFSVIIILIGIFSLIIKGGPALGIDFAGGILIQVKFTSPTNAFEIKDALKKIGLEQSQIQTFGEKADNEFLIRLAKTVEDLEVISSQIQNSLKEKYGNENVEIRRTEMVGPKVGKDLRKKGTYAVIGSIIAMLIYITFRFEFRFGIGSIVALIHDVLIPLGALSITNTEIDLPVIAAFLTIVGYSVNDTIVISDRIRENFRRFSNKGEIELINRSINETLSRTILTNLTALTVVVILFLLGGGVIHAFAFTMLIGFISGVYSTVFIASPVVIYWKKLFPKSKKKL